MPARTGQEYITGLRERAAAVYIHGEQVKDVTTHPALRNGVHTLASLYDMQHDPARRDAMTYTSPTTGERVGLSFITPRTSQDLERRRTMMTHWARASCGMMGRTPDFMNVTMMAMAAASDYFAQNRPEFKDNIQRYYEYIREHDLVLTHTLVNLQRNRNPLAAPLQDRTDAALAVVRETDAGIVVRGPRVLATLGPLADEIAVYPARNHQLAMDAQARYSFAFAIPTCKQGASPGPLEKAMRSISCIETLACLSASARTCSFIFLWCSATSFGIIPPVFIETESLTFDRTLPSEFIIPIPNVCAVLSIPRQII